MRFSWLRTVIVSVATISCWPAVAGNSAKWKPLDWMCPPVIDVEANQTLKKTPEGWRKFVDSTNYRANLEGIHFYDGEPEQMADLRPDDNGLVDVQDRPHWITCKYLATSVQLTRVLPRALRECRVQYDLNKMPKQIECR